MNYNKLSADGWISPTGEFFSCEDYGSLMCSICEEDAPDDIPWDFCPHCGNPMRKRGETE